MNDNKLNQSELDRIDELLGAARKFHYLAFSTAGTSIALSALGQTSGISLPFGDVSLPSTESAVALYLLVILLTIASDRFLRAARRWLPIDTRRPQYAWIALGSGEDPAEYATLWLLLPLLVAAIATGLTLEGDLTGWFLSFTGLLIVLTPRRIGEYWSYIQERTDHRGGPATLSMFLLYAYRIMRSIILSLWLFSPVIATIQSWQDTMISYSALVLKIIFPMFVVRFVGGLGFVYRRIDGFGTRFGFPTQSKHYE